MTKEPTLLCMSSSAFHLLRLHGPCTILAIEKILCAICAKKLRKQSFIFSIRFCVTLCIPCTCFSPHTGTWGYYDLRQEDWCGLMHQHVPGVGHPSGAQSVGSQEQQRWRMSKEAHLVIHLDNQSTLGSPTTKARPPRDSQVGPGPAKLSGLIFAPQSFPPSRVLWDAVSKEQCQPVPAASEHLSLADQTQCLSFWDCPSSSIFVPAPITPQRFLH